jgi:hypothetical protein
MLAGRLPGPPWLALPVTPGALLEHVAWEARLKALWAAALVPGFLVAAHGLLPVMLIVGLAAAFGLALWAGAHAATRFAHALAVAPHGAGGDRDAWLTLRMTPGTAVARRRLRPARWGRAPAWRVLVERDVLLVARVPAVRLTAAAFVLWGLASGAVWFTPLERPAAQVMAFGLALIAAFAWANVLVTLGGEEPVGLLRAQPVTPRALWTARAVEVLAGALAMAVLQAVAARLEPGPRALQAACVFGAALALGLLGAHYGITLGRQVQAARRLLVLTASIAMAASLMITLLGWLVLLAAVIHSALRVPRWWWLEETR